MNDQRRPARYLDCCDECVNERVIVRPIMVRSSDIGSGVVADYLCPAGHTWFTSWNYGDSDYRAA